MRSRNCLRCDIRQTVDGLLDLDTYRPYDYCEKCRSHMQDMRGLMKGLGKARAMKKYGSGRILEPQDLDNETELSKEATSKEWTPADAKELQQENDDND